MELRVFKFGGTSLGNPEALHKVISIIKSHAEGLCVVVSAMSGITDSLYKLYYNGVQGRHAEDQQILAHLRERHLQLVHDFVTDNSRRSRLENIIEKSVEDLHKISESLGVLREETPRGLSMTVCHGERLMAAILTEILAECHLPSILVDSTKLIKLVRERFEYIPDDKKSRMCTRGEVFPLLENGKLLVIPGFFGEGPDGEVMILGRGGSDYSATLIGSYLDVNEVRLYKEVDGLMTADPRHVYEARVLPELHYREATELAYYGAKVLHPRAIIPLVGPKIPLIVKCTFYPERPGTRITADINERSYPVKAISYIDRQAMISIEGNGMMGVPGVASRAFTAMAQNNISISFITQASSEASLCFVVPGEQGQIAKRALDEAFRFEIEHHLIDEIKLRSQLAVLAVVGLGMRGTPGIAARAFSCIAQQKVSVIAIAQGSSELNISIIIDQAEASRSLRALHREYGLEKIRAISHRNPREINLCIYGFGQIGQALTRQLRDQTEYLDQRLKLRLPIVALSDRSGLVLEEGGFSDEQLQAFLARKAMKKKLQKSDTLSDLEQKIENQLWFGSWDRKIFIDMTATDSVALIKRAIESGFHIVLANKKPLALPYPQYRELIDLAATNQVQLRYEATVGAGLPVLDTIDKLTVAGDSVQEILGCFSGTLGYLLTEIEDGVSFSVAVRSAFLKGYTEPDPRDDLSGMDVARKALILARAIGNEIDLNDIVLDPLFPIELNDDDPLIFIEKLSILDALYAQRMIDAELRGKTLRYVARISKQKVTVGLEEILKNSPLGRLRGTDNQMSIKTLRYSNNPLIVTGPGAGAEVTAAGVLNDIITIAVSQEQGGHG